MQNEKQTFRSTPRGVSKQAPVAAEAPRTGWRELWDRLLSPARQKWMGRAAMCLLAVLGVLALRAMDAQQQNDLAEQEQAPLGQLQFVSGEAYSLPMEGQVVETFSENGREVSIEGAKDAQVKAMAAGTVIYTAPDCVVVNNQNGTQTTYTGLTPCVLAGDTVESAQLLGSLQEEVLCLQTVSGIGYIDPLDAAAATQIEG